MSVLAQLNKYGVKGKSGWFGPPRGTHVGAGMVIDTAPVLASAMSFTLDEHYDEFGDTFGFGPCGVYSELVRQDTGMDVAIATAVAPDGQEFPHYVLWNDGIIDYTNPFDEPLKFKDIEILPKDEMPELVSQTEISWLRDRGVEWVE